MNQTGTICYLVCNKSKYINDFICSLQSLQNNYLNSYPCKVIAFYEKDLSESVRNDIISKSGIQVYFELIKFDMTQKYPDLGYRHMCQFFSNDIFNQNILNNFKYYCRFDTDSKLLSPVGFDFFNWMDTKKCSYGYINNTIKNKPCYCINLWKSFENFIKENNQFTIYKKLYKDIQELSLFYNNFEICNLYWFKSDPWKSFSSYITNLNGIYQYGWGDHNIRYAGISLYMEPNKIQCIPINYYHQGHFDTRN